MISGPSTIPILPRIPGPTGPTGPKGEDGKTGPAGRYTKGKPGPPGKKYEDISFLAYLNKDQIIGKQSTIVLTGWDVSYMHNAQDKDLLTPSHIIDSLNGTFTSPIPAKYTIGIQITLPLIGEAKSDILHVPSIQLRRNTEIIVWEMMLPTSVYTTLTGHIDLQLSQSDYLQLLLVNPTDQSVVISGAPGRSFWCVHRFG